MQSAKPENVVDFTPERRVVERVKEEIDASYLAEDGEIVACRIVDFSLMGACIDFFEPREVPDRIRVHVMKLGLVYDAEVRWRRDSQVGVLFEKAERVAD
ncbi:MAG: PilZ domain-containing protein [Pseudomonadota bacterium]